MSDILELDENKDGYLEPHNESDMPLFQHCTGGSISITYAYFGDCKSVFEKHGWTMYKRFKDRKVDWLQ